MARLTAVLISGGGSNLQALIDSTGREGSSARVALVISDRADAFGLERARRAGVPTCLIARRDFTERMAFDDAIDAALREAGVELVCLAGFMRLLGPAFVGAWRNRLLNIHPSLLPAYRGLHPHERALADGVRVSGCTVHYVRPEMDAGPIIVQGIVPVAPGDTAATLAKRVLDVEHRCYPLALELVASGRAHVEGERVTIEGAGDHEWIVLHPLLMRS